MEPTPEIVKSLAEDFVLGPNQIKWLEALESGRYEQCRGVLFNGTGYCCLGVGRSTLGRPLARNLMKVLAAEDAYDLGLFGPSGASDDGQFKLAKLNDDGVSFQGIVAAIRENPRRYLRRAK